MNYSCVCEGTSYIGLDLLMIGVVIGIGIVALVWLGWSYHKEASRK